MASITTYSDGRSVVQFVGLNGRRKTISLGRAPKERAEEVKVHVELLLEALQSGRAPKKSTMSWVEEQPERFQTKLAKVRLVPSTEKLEVQTLKAFLDRFISSRTDVKPRTKDIFERTRDSLVAFFRPDKPLTDITEGDAKEWRRYLLDRGAKNGGKLGANTVADRCKKAKQFFNAAVEFEYIQKNPFAKLRGSMRSNHARMAYISRADTLKVIEATAEAEFRVLIALCRFAGLRNPSETLSLQWEDIDFASDRMTVRSPKTEHHEGKDLRVVPIFADLRPFLDEAWERYNGESPFVISKWRDNGKNFRTRLIRTIKRAGLQPWPKLFHNLRSSCQTDLEEHLPSHVVCAWMGNSPRVAREHYLQVTEEHYQRALHVALHGRTDEGSPEQVRVSHSPEKSEWLRKERESKYTPQDSNLQPSVP